MTLKELIKQMKSHIKYELRYENMEEVKTSHSLYLQDYPVVELEEFSTENTKVYKVLITKNAQLHAKNIRKVKNCFECLRYPWCEDLSDELREEHAKDLK